MAKIARRSLAKQQGAVIAAVDSIAPECLVEVGIATFAMVGRHHGRKGYRVKNRLALYAVALIVERLLTL